MAPDDVPSGEAWLTPDGLAPVLRAERVVLRGWRTSDLEPFAALNADPRVMEHYPAALTRRESDDFVRERIVPQFAKHGFGLWAVEVPGVAPFIGYVGLLEHTFEARFTPCFEIGWRLAFPYWGHGYATEGARAALAFGFADAGLEEVVSFTVPANRRSISVMERLGMTQDGEFDHPRLPRGHPLQRHVLYRLTRSAWSRGVASGYSSRIRTRRGRSPTLGVHGHPEGPASHDDGARAARRRGTI